MHVGSGCDLLGRRISLCSPPPVGLCHLLGICGSGQHLGYKGVRVKRDRRYQLLELLLAEGLNLIRLLGISLFWLHLLGIVLLVFRLVVAGIGLLWVSLVWISWLRILLLPVWLGLCVWGLSIA